MFFKILQYHLMKRVLMWLLHIKAMSVFPPRTHPPTSLNVPRTSVVQNYPNKVISLRTVCFCSQTSSLYSILFVEKEFSGWVI